MSDQPPPPTSELIISPTQDVVNLRHLMMSLRDQVFLKGVDVDVIPGTQKPSLLLPGMEKIMRAMRLRPEYGNPLPSSIVDFERNLFYIAYECKIVEVDTGLVRYTAIGSCNSHESKYRWRKANRVCPNCGMEVRKSKNPGEGWYCWTKTGGCGATFKEDDSQIVNQVVGRVENEDVADQLNTIDKMAQKRALASAIKGAGNVSEFFTVDLEDFRNTPNEQPQEPPQRASTMAHVDEPPTGNADPNVLLKNDKARKAFYDEVKRRGMKTNEAYNTIIQSGHKLDELTHGQALAILFPSKGTPPEAPDDATAVGEDDSDYAF